MQNNYFGQGLSGLTMLSNEVSRSISPENLNGAKAGGALLEPKDGTAFKASRDLGRGWKVNPFIHVKAGETITLADIEGPGTIRHIWMTPTGAWRDAVLRFYWEGADFPSVECPAGDFFCSGWGEYAQVTSLPVCVNPASSFNCYWPMPFRKNCKITLENRGFTDFTYYYQIDYTLGEIPEEACYFHAQYKRVNPLPYGEVYTILDKIEGAGQYAGTYVAWGVNNGGWWGEGEVKFFLDGDGEFPTICTTGTEDYFCGSYDFENPKTHDEYLPFNTPYAGLPQVIEPDRLYRSQFRFGMYRWHIMDPIHFKQDLRVTMQALGWRADRRYLPLQDDIASVAYWYHQKPVKLPGALPDRDYLEVI